MNAYEFMAGSPWLTFFLAVAAGLVIEEMWKSVFRFFTIRKHGYPPSHCDADGDQVSDE